jgi:alanine dehydrogenase
MEKNTVTIKINGASITCKPEDVATIVSTLSGKSATNDKPVYEKSAVVHKALKNIVANTPELFTLAALANRDGLHTVFSGYNDEIRTRFDVNPVDVTESMIAAGSIKGRPAKRGFWITK